MSNKRKYDEPCYNISTKLILDDLESPVDVSSTADRPDELFIVEQRGIIWRYNIKTRERKKFLDRSKYLPTLSGESEERGLLSLALHPEFGTRGSEYSETFYIFYSVSSKYYEGNILPDDKKKEDVFYNCVSSFSRIKKNGMADSNSETIILSIRRDATYHNSGKMTFGPDNMLYISIGDGG